MNTYTLQINTSGAWRNVCQVAVNTTPRLERLKHAMKEIPAAFRWVTLAQEGGV